MLARLASDGATALHGLRRQLEEAAVGAEEPRAQNVLVGIIAFIIATSCSSFAGVYVELMLTGGDKPSLWLRNIQLAVYSSIAATIGLVATAPSNPMVREGGLFYGFGFWAWLCIAWQAAGGIIVAVVIKHAGNILRCFASGLAIIVGASASAAGSAAWRQSGQQVAAKYTANWTEPPSGIESGRLSNAPLLGNGDLGVSVGASLPGKPQPTPPARSHWRSASATRPPRSG